MAKARRGGEKKSSTIDRDKLGVFLCRLSGQELLRLLERAIDLLPESQWAELLSGYAPLEQLRPDARTAEGLLQAVKEFHEASLGGEYYESFNVNSKNYTQKSRGTLTWIAECERLFGLCITRVKEGHHAEGREALHLLFELLRLLDEGEDIVFFADEGGSWQVGIKWEEVLPAWFECLASAADPEDFARGVGAAIDLVGYRQTEFLKQARALATPEQRQALARTKTIGSK